MRAPALVGLACAAAISCAAHAGAYDALRVVAPQPDVTVHDNRGNVAVVVALSPPLRAKAGDRIALLLDGQTAARGSAEQFALTGIDRGTHTLQAQVVAADGSVLIVSAPVTFHMWRASRLFPGRKR